MILRTIPCSTRNRWLPLLGVCLALVASPGAAQTREQWDAERTQMTRAQMQQLLADFEQNAESTAYSRTMRERARREATLIRDRLENGDFQVGDRVALYVEGEEELADTFAVTQDTALALPVIGSIGLQGVLRSELQPYLQAEIGRFIRDPVVRAQSLIRVSILGAVGQPGFYPLPATTLLDDAIMMAGGPRADSKLTKVYVERDGEKIWEGESLQVAITQGRTLDQLNLQAGDRIYVPETGKGGTTQILQTLGIVSGALYAVLQVVRWL